MIKQVHSNEKSLTPSWKVSPWAQVQISRLHGQAQAWLRYSWNLLFKASPMRRGAAMTEASLKSSLGALLSEQVQFAQPFLSVNPYGAPLVTGLQVEYAC